MEACQVDFKSCRPLPHRLLRRELGLPRALLLAGQIDEIHGVLLRGGLEVRQVQCRRHVLRPLPDFFSASAAVAMRSRMEASKLVGPLQARPVWEEGRLWGGGGVSG